MTTKSPPMSDALTGTLTRREALSLLGAAGAALYGGTSAAQTAPTAATPAATAPAGTSAPASPDYAPAASLTWSPKPHPDAHRYFVIDGVAHCYNHGFFNRRNRRVSQTTLDVSYAYHRWSTPARWRMTQEQYERDWQPEEVMDVMFLESHTDMIAMHSTPLYSSFFDGLISNEKGAYLKDKYPERVIWYGAIDLFDDPALVKGKIDQLVIQGCDGIKTYPVGYNQITSKAGPIRIDDEKRSFPIFEYILKKGIKHLGVHKLVGYTGPETPAFGIDDFYRAAEAFPDLTFHLVHAGWLMMEETAELMAARPNVTAVLEGPMIWTNYDMPTFEKMMAILLKKVDINRIIYASTAPNQHPYWIVNQFFDWQPPKGSGLTITQEDKAKILGGNLARYHGIDIAARRARLANDRFSTYKARHGLREPYIAQRTEQAARHA